MSQAMNRTLVTAAWTVCLVSILAAGVGKVGERALGPSFKALDSNFRVAWGRMKTSGDMDFNKGEGKYTIEMEGAVESPPKVDAVALPKNFLVSAILDANGQDMTKPVKTTRQNVSPFKGVAYNAFHPPVGPADANRSSPVAQVEVPRQDIIRDATKIKMMKVESEYILAKKRDEAKLPAIVMEDYKDLVDGVSVRITGLDMSNRRELTVRMQYKRPAAGTESAFLEAIYALDTEGKSIGGGRWTEGDPFGKAGTILYRFLLDTDQVHKSFRFVVVTESETKPLTFELRDMFSGK